jgi:aryl-alcohol dehydrogenase-like predicted oxidoreductase
MPLQGWATPEGVNRYRERLKERADEKHFRPAQNLWLSSVGLGTYLGQWDEQTDRAYTNSVVRAVELGVNVIDTAANYRFQRSERSIGAALRELSETSGAAARDELLICTKGGYLPFDGEPPRDVRRYFEETFVKTGVASFSDIVAGSHCMTPRYLEHQIKQSLDNLGLETLDVYYLHNPETQLQEVSGEEFDERLARAFESFELLRAADKIRMYGAATWNGFRAAPDARGYLSLERMAKIARSVGGDTHGFRFIQLPFNLSMTEALVSENQSLKGQQVSLLEAAAALDITVVASASILQGKVARNLPTEVREPLGALATDAQTAIQFVRSTPGITTALVGMSRVAHVEENLQLARIAPAPPEDYQRLFKSSER